MKTVAIVIQSLHRPDVTARCIESVQRQTLPAEQWKIVVVENEAQAGSILPDPLPRNTMRIELPTNEGTTNSINRGMAAVPSPYVLLLNNDVELAPDYLQKLVKTLDADEALGFATGKLLRATDHTLLDGAGDAMILAGASYRLGHLDHDNGQFNQPMQLLSACGAAVLYRSKAFLLCGGLDADFFAYLDDLDLALRTHLIGYRGTYLPDAVAYHIGSATFGRALHPRVEFGRRLFWLVGIADEMLLATYEHSAALIAASEGVGFGLPLIEAARARVPIIARDLPVFREVAGDYAFYFSGATPDAPAFALRQWIALRTRDAVPKFGNLQWIGWTESARRLMNLVLGDARY